MKYMLDTNICIYSIKNRPEAVRKKLIEHLGQTGISSIVIRAHLARGGKSIEPYDLLLASHALSLNLTLVTNNLREFEHVPGLSLENWI